jgi:predicted GH43/DUF377 family glycosyl hydrolase
MVVHKKNTYEGVLFATLFPNGKIGMLESNKKTGGDFRFLWSEDGIVFTHDPKKVLFLDGLIKHKPEQCSNVNFFFSGKKIFVTYLRTVKTKKYKVIAQSKSAYEWEVVSESLTLSDSEFVVVSDIKVKKNLIAYEGGVFIKSLSLTNLENWKERNSLLFTTRFEHFDRHSIKLVGSYVSDKGTIVFYESIIKDGNNYQPAIGFVIFDKNDEEKIIWRSNDPVWKSDVWFSKENPLKSLGMVVNGDKIFFFFSVDNTLITASITENDLSLHIPQVAKTLVRHKKNPIISPHPHNAWESEAIFNPASLVDDNGHIHLIYRAIGSDGVSRLGYGYSEDGIHFNGRLDVPIFSLGDPRNNEKQIKIYDPVLYPSGGSWGGCEDPRVVRINGRIYITFNAFDGWDFIRIAAVSISDKDFFDKKWKWSKPILISPPNQINKNWVLFPEKINGKFAILHSISPKVQIDYVNKLEELEKGDHVIKSQFKQDPTKKGWDTWVRGVGPPPLRTEKGWLVLYHAMDHRDPNKYKLGAMLLDLKDPKKIISRSKEPILEPEMWYENDWKPGVVYSCGALIKNDTLFVYYGGGDKHVCVATSSLEKIFDKLK